MRGLSWAFLGLLSLGGCIFAGYGYDRFDEGGGGSGAAAGQVTSGSASGQGGGAGTCGLVLCDHLDGKCANPACPSVVIAHRFGTADEEQTVHALAVADDGSFALGGNYDTKPFDLAGKTIPATNGNGVDAFAAYFSVTGNVIALNSLSYLDVKLNASTKPRDLRGLTFVNPNVLFAAGTTTQTSVPRTLMAPLTVSAPTLNGGDPQIFGGLAGDDGIGIVTDGQDVYLLARTSQGFGKDLACGNFSLSAFQAGLLVAKFDNAGECGWTKMIPGDDVTPTSIAAVKASVNGVWVTGSFKNQMGPVGNKIDAGATEDMFLLKLTSSGVVDSLLQFGDGGNDTGTVRPSSIAVDDGSSGNPRIYVTGEVVGDTELFSPGAPASQVGAFVLGFDGTSQQSFFTKAYPGNTDLDQGARGLGVALDGTNLYVAGTYTTTITLDAQIPPVSDAPGGAAIFLAALDPASGDMRWFDTFPGGTQSFADATSIHLGAVTLPTGGKRVVLAGTWISTLDVSTGGTSMVLDESGAQSTKGDGFVALFDVP